MTELKEVSHGATEIKSDRGRVDVHCGEGLLQVSKISEYINNPKEHPEEQIKRLSDQIFKHGWDQQIVVDGNFEIVLGHGRLKAAKKLGLDKVPVTVREDLTKLDAKERRIADNRLSETDMIEEKLAEETQQLVEADDHEELMLGMDDSEVSELLDDMDGGDPIEEVEAEDPDEIETDIQEGDMFKLGRHRLICGDSTSQEVQDRLMDGKKADMVFTDPPYNVDYGGKDPRGWSGRDDIKNDKQTDEEWRKFNKISGKP